MNFNTFLQSIQVLLEAAYDSKVISVKKKYPEQSSLIDSVVVKLQKKQDRIFWFLRIIEEFETNKKLSDATLGGYNFKSFSNLLTDLEHFYGYPYPPIQQLTFNKQSIGELIAELKKLEKQYQEKVDNEKGVEIKEGDRVLFDFGSTKWWILNRAYCSDEGRSGKHCGNAVGQEKPNQRILSLRNNANQVILTFILEPETDSSKINMKNPEGYLGEMKAKGNTKPQEKYHPQIMKLLLSPITKGIRGKGFLPGANFSIFDLSEKDITIIDENKPSLIKDQIKITPTEILNTPRWLKEKYAKGVPYSIRRLFDDNSLKGWTFSIEDNKELLLNLPEEYWSEYPDFYTEVAKLINKETDLLSKAPKKISNNFTILTKLIDMSPMKFTIIPKTYKKYKDLVLYTLNKSLFIAPFIDDKKIVTDLLGVDIKDIIDGYISISHSDGSKFKDKVVFGNVTIDRSIKSLTNMPKIVTGDFDCDGRGLKTLEGAPEIVGGGFYCSNNQLETLEGGPKRVDVHFMCDDNQLKTLEGAPKNINGNFSCSGNQLESLEGAPEIVRGMFFCRNQTNGKHFTKEDVMYFSEVKGKIET